MLHYRPITLLNTDYRAFTRVLAGRLGKALSTVIDPQQAAFLPNRSISNSIITMQLLPRLLAHEQRTALAVLCDFRKAYDTIDRSFLLQALMVLGVERSFLRMVARLLTGRRARAQANGYLSRPASFAAGVPQGCPLSPALYLVIGQALSRWLSACGIGIAVAGMQLSCTQYADDSTAYLPSPASLPAFMAVMQRFGHATGQQLNTNKTVAMPIGPPGRNAAQPIIANQPAAFAPAVAAADTHAAGQIRVVQQATSLGVPLVNDWGTSLTWQPATIGPHGSS